MSQPVQFKFGVEIETRTSSKSKKHNSWLRLAKEVSQELTKKGIPSHIIQAEWEKSEEKYQDWSLMTDETVSDDALAHKYSLELVSFVLSYSDPEWLNQINTTWSVLDAKFDVEKGLSKTSTHVHLSPISDGWTIGSVRNVALAAVFFERSIDSIVPVLRRANIWCQSNRHNANLQSLKMPEIFKKLNSFNNIGTVVSYMNTMSKNSLFGKERLKEDDFKCRYFRWNLTSCKSGKGTIEFRQAPGSECKENTLTWITFAVSFATAAVTGAGRLDPKKEPTSLDELKDFVHSGAKSAKVTGKNWQLIENLFDGKKLLPAGIYAYDAMKTSKQDLDLMTKKAKEKNITLEKFKKLYGYK